MAVHNAASVSYITKFSPKRLRPQKESRFHYKQCFSLSIIRMSGVLNKTYEADGCKECPRDVFQQRKLKYVIPMFASHPPECHDSHRYMKCCDFLFVVSMHAWLVVTSEETVHDFSNIRLRQTLYFFWSDPLLLLKLSWFILAFSYAIHKCIFLQRQYSEIWGT